MAATIPQDEYFFINTSIGGLTSEYTELLHHIITKWVKIGNDVVVIRGVIKTIYPQECEMLPSHGAPNIPGPQYS
jgi:hypothetical protein